MCAHVISMCVCGLASGLGWGGIQAGSPTGQREAGQPAAATDVNKAQTRENTQQKPTQLTSSLAWR